MASGTCRGPGSAPEPYIPFEYTFNTLLRPSNQLMQRHNAAGEGTMRVTQGRRARECVCSECLSVVSVY